MIDCPDDYPRVGNRMLWLHQKTAGDGHVCDLCGCSGSGSGEQAETRIVIDEDVERLATKRYCLQGAPCLLEAHTAEFKTAEEMRKALDEPWNDWLDDHCTFCGTNGLRGDDGIAIPCPDCRDRT